MYNILVTGGTGFLGTNIIKFLIKNTNFNIFSLQRTEKIIDKRVKIVIHDLNLKIPEVTVEQLKDIDYVIHLAGGSDIQESFLNIYQTYHNNMISTLNILDFCSKIKLKKIIFVSTAEVFGNSENKNFFKEEDNKSPKSPYANSKYFCETLFNDYYKIHKVPTVILRVMNVFGSYQNKNKFIPQIINKISNEEELIIHSNVGPIKRNYIHVEDLCYLFLFMLNNGIAGETYNVTSDEYTDNLEIALIISEILEKKIKYKLINNINDYGCLSLLDGEKLFKMGWKPKINLRDGLRKVIYE